MSRTLSVAMAAHLATGRLTLARCLRLDLTDGTSVGFTTLDVDISVNLGDGALTYSASKGVVPSALSLSLGFDADNLDAGGPIGTTITRAQVLGGRYRAARARLFDVNFDDTTQIARLMGGKVTNPRVRGGEFVFEIRSHVAAYNQTVGRVLSPYCDADFGDARCGATPLVFPATIAAVNSDLSVTVTFTGATPTSAQAVGGTLDFLTGALTGTLPVELFAISGGLLALYLPFVEAPQVGDTLTLTEGCDKLRATCVLKQGDAITFRGMPDLSGNDAYVQFPTPG